MLWVYVLALTPEVLLLGLFAYDAWEASSSRRAAPGHAAPRLHRLFRKAS